MKLYEMNKTMKLLGEQCYFEILKDSSPEREAYNDMMNAYRENGNTHYADVAMDAFVLGYIYGKRAERARRRAGHER